MRPRIRGFAKCGLLKDFTFPPLVKPGFESVREKVEDKVF
jgi:hypothetical protein